MHLHDCWLRCLCHFLFASGHAHWLWTTQEHRRNHSCHTGTAGGVAVPSSPARQHNPHRTSARWSRRHHDRSKYPQAIGISSILACTATFGNFKWEILHNDFTDNPFFTSDFPVAIEKTDDPRILNRVVPLAPDIALRIRPDLTLDRGRSDFSSANFGYRKPQSRPQRACQAQLFDRAMCRRFRILSRRLSMGSAVCHEEPALPH